jgi:dCTP diphosphatase
MHIQKQAYDGGMHTNNLTELTKKLVALRDTHGLKKLHNPKDLALSLAVGSSDILEHFQWLHPEESSSYVNAHRKELAVELIIILNYALLMAHDYKIDIEKYMNEKIKDNSMKYPFKKAKVVHIAI